MCASSKVARLMAADVDQLLAEARDPEAAILRLVRDIETLLLDLRREAVDVLATEKRLARELRAASRLADDVETRAARALDRGDEVLAHQILGRGLCLLAARDEAQQRHAPVARRRAELPRLLLGLDRQAVRARLRKDQVVGRVARQPGVVLPWPQGRAAAGR
jgi:phage shock protein A